MLTTNITHFLNPHGNIARDMPSEARELASFLFLIIEDTTAFEAEAWGFETKIRCNQKNCQGKIHSRLLIEQDHEIYWWCPVCKNEGIISDWKARNGMGVENKFSTAFSTKTKMTAVIY
jgi:hypothetical protein